MNLCFLDFKDLPESLSTALEKVEIKELGMSGIANDTFLDLIAQKISAFGFMGHSIDFIEHFPEKITRIYVKEETPLKLYP